jgi:hypothetical protein
MPFSVVLNVLSPSRYSIRPFSIKSARYSLVIAWERYTSYIIFVTLTLSPLALKNLGDNFVFISILHDIRLSFYTIKKSPTFAPTLGLGSNS